MSTRTLRALALLLPILFAAAGPTLPSAAVAVIVMGIGTLGWAWIFVAALPRTADIRITTRPAVRSTRIPLPVTPVREALLDTGAMLGVIATYAQLALYEAAGPVATQPRSSAMLTRILILTDRTQANIRDSVVTQQASIVRGRPLAG